MDWNSVLKIDEEGFPHFDGIRIDEEAFLKATLGSLRRREAGVAGSCLLCHFQGQDYRIEAFDAPLVAQSVDDVSDQRSRWVFPGGLSYEVDHQTIEVDSWDRLHAWIGPEAIPAVLSRKAQAALLDRVSAGSLSPLSFRQAAPDRLVGDSQFWEDCYQEGRAGWDLRKPNPILVAHQAELLSLAGRRMMVPGAGRGHDVAFLESLGGELEICAVDFATSAARDFRNLYPLSRVEYLQADLWALMSRQKGHYDSVFEHTLYCALDPLQRRSYFEAVHSVLAPGGVYFGIFLLRPGPGGPPFGTTQWELQRMTEGLFTIEAWEISSHSEPSRLGLELWAVLRKG